MFASGSLYDRLRLPISAHSQLPKLARDLMAGSWEAIRGADLVVHHPILIFAPEMAARLGAPAMTAAPQPVAATGAFPLCFTSRRHLGRTLNRATYRLIDFERLLVAKTLRTFLASRGAPPRRPVPTLTPSTLHGYSPSVGPVADDWGDAVAVTGAWEAPPRKKWVLPPEVEAFLEAGPPPVYVGFGSMPWRPERNRRVIVEAVSAWGGRAIVGRGWGGVAEDGLPPEILAVGNAPHARLFPRVAAVVHHGGAGTTATGLAAGRPSFVAPILMDQFFWGERVRRLGAGPAPVPLAKLDAGTLAARLRDLTTNPAYAAAAADVAGRMAGEDGVAAACDAIERAMARAGGAAPATSTPAGVA